MARVLSNGHPLPSNRYTTLAQFLDLKAIARLRLCRAMPWIPKADWTGVSALR